MPLDRRMPRRAFSDTQASLREQEASLAPEVGPVSVGWGRAEIVAPPGAPLAGYGSRRGAPHQGVHDRTFAKAIAIAAGEAPPVVFVAADLLLLPPELDARLRADLRGVLPRERLVFTASHTHSGIGGFAHGFPWTLAFGAPDPAAERAVLDAIEAAVKDALRSISRGRFAFGEVLAPGLSKNRVRKSGSPVDPFADLLLVERESDHRRAALVVYSAHATTISDREFLLSADYPGVTQQTLEGELDLVAFSAGAVGSMSPRADGLERAGAEWEGRALATAMGRAIPAVAARLRDHARIALLRFPVRLPRQEWRLGAQVALQPMLSAAIVPGIAHVQAIAFDNDVWVALPVELSGEIASELKTHARTAGALLAITAFDGDYCGYVVPKTAYDLEEAEQGELAEYETRTMSFYGPWMGALFRGVTWEAAKAVRGAVRDPTAALRGPFVRVAPPPPPPEPAR
jgi:hypothetical protein